jgi:hypothetical protein
VKLLRQWLKAGVMEDGRETAMLSGTPQGGVISPLLSNIYLSYLDDVWQKQCAHLGVLVRYADDFVVMCETEWACEEAERRVKLILARLKLELHPDKTRRVELTRGREGFDFLGCHLHKRMSGPLWERTGKKRYFLQRWPSARSMKRVRQRVKELTGRSRNGVKDVRSSTRPGESLGPRLLREPRAHTSARLYPLSGGCVMHIFERPPVSRVREIRTHGLKGGLASNRRGDAVLE